METYQGRGEEVQRRGQGNELARIGQEEMTTKFKVGDRVRWNSEADHVSGRIIKVHVEYFDYKGHTHHASPDDPTNARQSQPRNVVTGGCRFRSFWVIQLRFQRMFKTSSCQTADAIAAKCVSDGKTPGIAIGIMQDGKAILEKPTGWRTLSIIGEKLDAAVHEPDPG